MPRGALDNVLGDRLAGEVLAIKAATGGSPRFAQLIVFGELLDERLQFIKIVEKDKGLLAKELFELCLAAREREDAVSHQLGEPRGGVEEVLLTVEVQAHFTLREHGIVVLAPDIGLAEIAEGFEIDQLRVELIFECEDQVFPGGVLVAVAAKKEIVGQVVALRIVEGFDGGIGGVGDVVDRGALAAKGVQPGAGGGDKDGVHALRAVVDGLDIVGHEERVHIAVGDAHARHRPADGLQRAVSNQVAMSQQDEVGFEIGGGFQKFAVHLADAQIAQAEGGEERSHVAVAEVQDMVVPADQSVMQLVFRADAGFPVASDLGIADLQNSHSGNLLVRFRRVQATSACLDMNEFVALSTHEPFARGGNRACYVDPREASRCIKVALPGRTAAEKRQRAPWLKRLRPLGYYDDNLRELATYKRLEATGRPSVWTHLPACHGLVETDLGPGIVTDLVRNFDGSLSLDLKAKLRDTGRDANFSRAVDDFAAYLRQTRLPTRDLLLHNLVARNMDAGGTFVIYVIDGFGSADMLPLAYWSKRLASAKVERKIVKFHAKIDEFCHKYSIPETR